MKRSRKFLLTALTTMFLMLKLSSVSAQLNSSGIYVWNASTLPRVFNGQFQLSFVSPDAGFPNYGTVLAGGGFYNGEDGSAFQMYFPYNSYFGGTAPKVRLGVYSNQGWSDWSTFFTTANADLPTADWVTNNLTAYGNVLIGKTTQTNTSYKLDVDGIIRSQKVVVNTTGADFVFDSTYHLPKLDTLNAFIKKYHHLPAIEPAAQMQTEGLDIGENETKLLQKIEELTLIIIQQNERIERLEEREKNGNH